jgi:hypothetical protein
VVTKTDYSLNLLNITGIESEIGTFSYTYDHNRLITAQNAVVMDRTSNTFDLKTPSCERKTYAQL